MEATPALKAVPTITQISEQGSQIAQKALSLLDEQLDLSTKDATISETRTNRIAALAQAAEAGVGAMDDSHPE
jgi:hypothetical protein